MRSIIILGAFFCIIFSCIHVAAQKVVEGVSPNYSFSITKEIKPPILNIVDGSIHFTEPSGNDIIDAGESCLISFELENTGPGDGKTLALKVNAQGSTEGLSFEETRTLNDLKTGQKMKVELPVRADLNTTDGSVTFILKVEEPHGFNSDEKLLEVKTLKFVSPMVEVVDYSVTGGRSGSLVKKYPFDLQILVQNTKYGKAEGVTVNLTLPENVFMIAGSSTTSIPLLKPGETKSIVYSLIVNDNFSGANIPVKVKLGEKYGKYSKNRDLDLALNQAVAAGKIVIEGSKTPDSKPEIVIATLSAAVDKNIPSSGVLHNNRYALIIGNEDYSSRQPGLSKEINVDFAENDARIFKQYVVNTFGVPERQVKLLINATAAEIRRDLAWIRSLSRLANGSAELIFYYSGHGLPDEITHEPFLIPVDVSGSSIREGIRLGEVYSDLTENPCQRVTVFLDACFSGGARNQGLVAMKSVKIKPADESLSGNIVVFSSSSGEESSGVDHEKQHGYFTWFLLKKLQETKGDITYKDLGDDMIRNVSFETTLISKPQTPQVLFSPDVSNVWESWKLK